MEGWRMSESKYSKVNDFYVYTKLFWQEKIEGDFFAGDDDYRIRESEFFVLGYNVGETFVPVTEREDESNLVYSRILDSYLKDNHGHCYRKYKRKMVEGDVSLRVDYYASLGVDDKFLKGLEKVLSERPRFYKLKFESVSSSGEMARKNK
jgi:hypothetical protein